MSMSGESDRRILAIVRDLFFSVRIKEHFEAHGYAVAVVKSPQALADALADAPPAPLTSTSIPGHSTHPQPSPSSKATPRPRRSPSSPAFGSHLYYNDA